jgi:phosphatidate cytidylyltransferase
LLLKRELAAAIAIPVVLSVLFFFPPLAFDLLVAAVSLAALWEFYRLAERTGHPVAKTVGIGGGLLAFGPILLAGIGVWVSDSRPAAATGGWWVLVGVVLFLTAVAPLFSGVGPESALATVGSTLAGIALVALPATALCYLRHLSPRAVLFLFLIVWGCDSFAYYTGKNLGRRKLAPVVSPNKTWEGAVGGLVGATLIGAAAGTWWVLPELGTARAAVAGALASSAGQLGDLVESLWKRGAGVKDSGVFLPGHGGFYDRIDSLLWAAPVLALFVAPLR